MSRPLFVSISGKKGSGKDTLATHLAFRLGLVGIRADITHFADPLKEMCINIFGLDRKLVYGSNADKETPTDVRWAGFPLEVRQKYSKIVLNDMGERVTPFERDGLMSIRELLQVMGTDIFRERVYHNIWAELPFKQQYPTDTDVVLIADCRFPNEVEETLKNNGLVLRVLRTTGMSDNHPSETALDNYVWPENCHFIYNDKSMDNLIDQATEWANRIKEIVRGK